MRDWWGGGRALARKSRKGRVVERGATIPEAHGLNAKSLFLSCPLADLKESHSYQDKSSCFLRLFRMLFGGVLLLRCQVPWKP